MASLHPLVEVRIPRPRRARNPQKTSILMKYDSGSDNGSRGTIAVRAVRTRSTSHNSPLLNAQSPPSPPPPPAPEFALPFTTWAAGACSFLLQLRPLSSVQIPTTPPVFAFQPPAQKEFQPPKSGSTAQLEFKKSTFEWICTGGESNPFYDEPP
ncbi:hypothetical protein K438DRAFT_1764460 [Mycena galopus ATCC 62051]|nr:hypothetical protein K438DRAFT_1764460 [Mycena galopus ATCC 62051]